MVHFRVVRQDFGQHDETITNLAENEAKETHERVKKKGRNRRMSEWEIRSEKREKSEVLPPSYAHDYFCCITVYSALVHTFNMCLYNIDPQINTVYYKLFYITTCTNQST